MQSLKNVLARFDMVTLNGEFIPCQTLFFEIRHIKIDPKDNSRTSLIDAFWGDKALVLTNQGQGIVPLLPSAKNKLLVYTLADALLSLLNSYKNSTEPKAYLNHYGLEMMGDISCFKLLYTLVTSFFNSLNEYCYPVLYSQNDFDTAENKSNFRAISYPFWGQAYLQYHSLDIDLTAIKEVFETIYRHHYERFSQNNTVAGNQICSMAWQTASKEFFGEDWATLNFGNTLAHQFAKTYKDHYLNYPT